MRFSLWGFDCDRGLYQRSVKATHSPKRDGCAWLGYRSRRHQRAVETDGRDKPGHDCGDGGGSSPAMTVATVAGQARP